MRKNNNILIEMVIIVRYYNIRAKTLTAAALIVAKWLALMMPDGWQPATIT